MQFKNKRKNEKIECAKTSVKNKKMNAIQKQAQKRANRVRKNKRKK